MDGCKTFVRPVTYNAKSMSIKTVEVPVSILYIRISFYLFQVYVFIAIVSHHNSYSDIRSCTLYFSFHGKSSCYIYIHLIYFLFS